jgi:hypothetical protein
MRRSLSLIVACIAGGLLPIAHAANAPAPAAAKKSSDCAAPAPRPLLPKAAYAAYSFEPGPENTAVEKASSGTVHLEIQTAGCYDGYEHAFVFTDDNPLADYDDRDHWLYFATEQLKALKTFRRGQADVKDLLSFLAGAKSATARKNDSELRLEVCRDASPPTEDGCPKSSGGGYRFAVRALDKKRVEVYVSRYLAL